MEQITDVKNLHECAHEQCHCQVRSTEEYCSDYCSDADDVAEIGLTCSVDTLHARGTEWMFDRQYVATTNAARRRWIMNVFELRRKVILCTTAAALCLVGV